MTQMPVMRELQPLTKPGRRGNAAKTAWSQFVATIINPDLVMVVVFCAIGLLVSANVMLHFPEVGATIVQLEQFP